MDNSTLDIKKIQTLLQQYQLDGWLFTDFQGHDFITKNFLQLSNRKCTRRLFYFIPSYGQPVKLLSAIEPLLLDHLPGEKRLYSGMIQQKEALQKILCPDAHIALQYSPDGNVPVTSSIDAGLMEYLLGFHIIPVSSENLLQHFGAVLTDAQIESHRQAGVIIHRILNQSFSWIRDSLNAGKVINEWDLLQKMKELIDSENIYMDSPPFFGIDEHTCDPGYEPTPESAKVIKEGSRLMIDIAGRLPNDDSIYYDVSWCMNVGSHIDPEYQWLFNIVKDTRQTVFDYIQSKISNDEPICGCDADRLTQNIIKEHGLESFIMHRTGHNIGHNCHGIGANLDDYETHDTRQLLPGTMFSIEPGIYMGSYGVRLEYDVHITPQRQLKIYGPIQEEILII